MKVIYNLKELSIIESGKTTKDKYGYELSNKTINTILSLITRKYVYSKYQMTRINSDEFININKDYKKYLNHFYDRGVILWSNYTKGIESRGYYFTDYFKNRASIIKIEIEASDYETNRTPFNFNVDEEVDIKLRRDYKFLTIENTKIQKDIEINNEKLFIYNFKGYITSVINLEMIKLGYTYYNWKSGRLYTNFCNCNESVRLNNFTFNGEKLTTLDIPSSFPLWLAIWCLDKGININDYDFISYCTDLVKKDKNGKSSIYESIRINLNSIKDLDSDGDNETAKAKPYYSRSQAKEAFMKWINGEEKNDIINNMFSIYYGPIFKLVDRTKYKMYDELVKLETNFIMNIIIKKLYKIRGIKILTCHDQIYFQEKYSSEVEIIWNAELVKMYNLLPVESSNEKSNYSLSEIYIPNFNEINKTNIQQEREEFKLNNPINMDDN